MQRERAQPNRLAQETSPYLLQHAHNPVDWYPWGPEALELAREQDRPIFLSVGYSACHWCHVMEAESFADERVAEALRSHFVSIKVDREERPDLDELYMRAVQAFSGGHGGWPMSVFLTPDLLPFFGGTYFPPERRGNVPGFLELVQGIARYWRENREDADKRGRGLREALARDAGGAHPGQLESDLLDRSLDALRESYDAQWGGWGSPPKFPHPADVRLCLRHGLRTGEDEATHMALHTLRRMARGGLRDQLTGGFARYSTDNEWRVPHFEKMLYDNAQLVPAYLEGYLASGDEWLAAVARETCAWMLSEMRTSEGAFASSLDADTEGEEGRYYVWERAQLLEVLGEELGELTAECYDVRPEGNFEHGRSVLWCPREWESIAEERGLPLAQLEAQLADARQRLARARDQRVSPARDDKVLCAWNGLAISALAQAYQVLEDEPFLRAASEAARYVLGSMRQLDGRLHATARLGRAHLNACLDDYAFLVAGLIDLYESDFDGAWLEQALQLDEILQERFEDERHGGWFTTGHDHEPLPARLRPSHDGALPSGISTHALSLLRLGQLTSDPGLEARAERALQSVAGLANRYPRAFPQLLLALDHRAASPREIVVAGGRDDPLTVELLRTVRRSFVPQRIVVASDGGAHELVRAWTEGRPAPEQGAEVHVCRAQSCQLPVHEPAALRRLLHD